jgi:hypothetical protein
VSRAWWLTLVVLLAACDPVHDDAVDALGGEIGGVGPGPLHRPGQPCLLCHDGTLGNPEEFSVAGTVFVYPSSDEPAGGAVVQLTDEEGSTFRVRTNRAGNFYLSPGEYSPNYPLEVQVEYGGETVVMKSTIGREGACAGCHSEPAGFDSPGRVYVMLDDGGVP